MKRMRASLMRLLGLLPNERREKELADEIEMHLQMHTDDNMRLGMSPEQARREAVWKLGGIESTKEAYRARRTMPLIENAIHDCRFALRQLGKNSGFTVTAILMLAIGICASVAIFAFVDAALIKPLPYKNTNRLAGVFESVKVFPQSSLSYQDYLDWKKQNSVFSSLDAYNRTGFMLSTPSGSVLAKGALVSDGFFQTLGVMPILGRDFYRGEDLPDAPRTVILSYSAWQNQYGGTNDVIGRVATLNGQPTVVVGVLPQDFHFAPVGPAEYWTTLHANSYCDLQRGCHNLIGIGRLNDGVSMETAQANMASIAKQLEAQYPDSNQGQGASILPLTKVIVGDIRPTLFVLLGGAGLLLVIAAVNVASLLLVRSESRKREIAVRTALGASPARLISLFITEGVVLVTIGATLGLVSASGMMQLLTKLIPADLLANMPYLQNLGLNERIIGFVGIISITASALFSVTPALHLSLSKMSSGLAEGSRGSVRSGWRKLGSKLVVLELAIAVILLVGAGLLGKSFYRLLNVQLGMQPDHVVTIQVVAPAAKKSGDQQPLALHQEVIRRIANLPGVTSVGLSNKLPISGNGNTRWFRVVGRPYNGEHNEVNQRQVSTAYFATLQSNVVRGRYFTEADDSSHPNVAIVNRALVRQYFQNEDPIGERIGDATLSAKSLKEIVGVVEDLKEGSLDSDIWPAIYVPFNQSPDNYFCVVVRTSQDEQAFMPTLTAAIHDVDRDLVTFFGASMREVISNSPSAYLHRSSAWLVGGFASIALLLSVVGLYGVVAYSVSQRTREIGVRVALGAQRSSVYRLILKEAGWLIGLGIVIGLGGAVLAATAMRGILFGVTSWDVPTLLAVAGALGFSALMASFIPARRAASVNPVDALRAE